MRIIWTSHARERCRQRGVNPDAVEKAVKTLPEVRSTRYEHRFHGFSVILCRALNQPDYAVVIITVHRFARRKHPIRR